MAIGGYSLAPQLLYWMKADPDVLRVGTPYLIIIALASVPRMLFAVIAASLRATGDTKTPMWVSLWMNIINVLLNFPLIYGIPAIPALGFEGTPALGLTGSGIATAIALLFAACAVGVFAFSGKASFQVKRHHFKPHLPTLKSILRISYPSFIEESLISVGFLTFFRFIAILGTTALAAHAIATRIEALSFMAGVGFAVAAGALVGQALGRKDVEQARLAFRISTKYCVGLMSAIAVVLILLAGPIVSLFAPGNIEIQEIAVVLLIIAAIEQPLLGIGMTLGGGLRGAGDTVTPMISSLICIIGLRVGASYWLAFPMGYGIYGMYIGTMLDWMMRATLLFFFFRWERWTRIKI
jgi:putative MATE family efflux protein